MLTYAMSKESINVKAAFVHNVSDALASVGVIVAGTLILLYDLYVADLVVTVAIAAYVLYQGFSMIGRTIRILMGAAPPDIEFDRSEEHTSELQSLMRISYAVFCLNKKTTKQHMKADNEHTQQHLRA